MCKMCICRRVGKGPLFEVSLQPPHTHTPLASGYQALLMAPTELLAEQHYATLLSLAEDMPVSLRPRVALVVASIKPKVCGRRCGARVPPRQPRAHDAGQACPATESPCPHATCQERKQLHARIAAGGVDLLVGTQALLQQTWAALGLVVIDEQHK